MPNQHQNIQNGIHCNSFSLDNDSLMHSQLSSASSTESFRLTSQIQGQFNSAIYRCSSNNELSRLPVKQQYHADGKLYIEYIPGHNVLFLPTAIPIEAPIKKLRKSQRQKEAQAIQKPIELAKPNNAFIRYRSYRLRDIKQLYPQANQTDLSRIAAEYWRTEDPKIKEFFQKQYKEALQFYHQKLKIQHLAAKYHAQSRSVALPPSNPEEQLQAAANSSATSSSAETSDTDSPVLLTLKRRRSLSAPPEVSDLFSIKRICK